MNDVSHLVRQMKKPTQYTAANCVQTANPATAEYAVKVSGSVLDKIPLFASTVRIHIYSSSNSSTKRNEMKRQLPKTVCSCLTSCSLSASLSQDCFPT